MISPDHAKALQENNTKLLKENTQLKAQLNHMNKQIEKFQRLTHEKVESTIRLYDKCNEKVIKYLKLRNPLLPINIKHVKSLFPLKLP